MALLGSLGQRVGGRSAPNEQLGRPTIHGRRRSGEVIVGVFLEYDMEIGAAEAESADAGTARPSAAVDPWSSFGVEKERPLFKGAWRVWLLDKGRRQNLVMQRQAGFDEPGNAGGTFAVPDHRFD